MTEQTPLISGFGPNTTAEGALSGRDLAGNVAIVTGEQQTEDAVGFHRCVNVPP